MENQENKSLTAETVVTEDSIILKLPDKEIIIPVEVYEKDNEQNVITEARNNDDEALNEALKEREILVKNLYNIFVLIIVIWFLTIAIPLIYSIYVNNR